MRRRFLERLSPPPLRPIVPFMQTVHDRAAVEIQRGCVRGCRFCQAGVIYRPRRERSCDEVLDAARALLAATGYDELGLLSLNTADHSEIGPMVEALRREFGERLAIALPSLRVDSFSVRLAGAASGPGRRNITFAPEAGSQRLRNVINKPTTDDDLLQAAETAFEHGWTNVKLYFMVGLPTETLEDVQGIVDLAAAVQRGGPAAARRQSAGEGEHVHLRPQAAHALPVGGADDPPTRSTPATTCCDATSSASASPSPGTTRSQSLLEAMLSRGDRRLGAVIERAWRLGARFDAWNELLDLGAWQTALAEAGLDAVVLRPASARRVRDAALVAHRQRRQRGVPARRVAQGAQRRDDARLPTGGVQRLRPAGVFGGVRGAAGRRSKDADDRVGPAPASDRQVSPADSPDAAGKKKPRNSGALLVLK